MPWPGVAAIPGGTAVHDVGTGDAPGARSPGGSVPWLSRSRHPTGAVIVMVAGRVEGAAAAALNPYLHRCFDEHPAVLVVDLGRVEALDGDALWSLYQVGQRAQRGTCEMRIAGATPATLRAVDAAAMIEDFRIYPTVAAALNLTTTPQMPLAVLNRARKRPRSWLVSPTGPAADGTCRPGATPSRSMRDRRAR